MTLAYEMLDLAVRLWGGYIAPYWGLGVGFGAAVALITFCSVHWWAPDTGFDTGLRGLKTIETMVLWVLVGAGGGFVLFALGVFAVGFWPVTVPMALGAWAVWRFKSWRRWLKEHRALMAAQERRRKREERAARKQARDELAAWPNGSQLRAVASQSPRARAAND